MSFEPGFKFPTAVAPKAFWFVYHRGRLLLKRNADAHHIPDTTDLALFKLSPIREQYLGALNGRDCYAAELSDIDRDLVGFDLIGLRDTFGELDEELIWIAGKLTSSPLSSSKLNGSKLINCRRSRPVSPSPAT